MDSPRGWNRAWVSLWYALIGSLIGSELWALFSGRRRRDPTLTEVITREIRWFVTIPTLLWLFLHFIARYFGFVEGYGPKEAP